MTSKNHRQGGKMGGKHTTVIDAAQPVVDLAQILPEVTKVSAGYITSGIKTGPQRIKIKKMVGGLLLIVRGNISIQEIRVYTSDIEKTKKTFEKLIEYFYPVKI
jgi:hypothetical protein